MSFFNGVNAKALEDAPDSFPKFAVGENEARIDSAKEGMTKDGSRKMMTVTFKKDNDAEIKHYIVDNEWKFQNLKQLYTAFDIPFSSTDTADWLYKRGIVVCKEDMYEGKPRPKVSYLKAAPSGGQTQNRSGGYAGSANPPQNSGYGQTPNGTPDDGFDDDIPF